MLKPNKEEAKKKKIVGELDLNYKIFFRDKNVILLLLIYNSIIFEGAK